MASRLLRHLLTGVCPGALTFVVFCLVISSPMSPFWSEGEAVDPEPLEAHTPQATSKIYRDPRTNDHISKPRPIPPRVGARNRGRAPPNIYSGGCDDDQLCLHYLTSVDRNLFDQCIAKTKSFNVSAIDNGTCRFTNRHGRGTIALASFPGSGNTWIRGLLEMATGICTGAFVCDISLRAKGFSGENVQSGAVLVVKTHRWAPLWVGLPRPAGMEHLHDDASYTAAIVLIRNPFHALVAEWSRQVANGFHSNTITLQSHAESVGPEWFGANPKWEEYARHKIRLWQTMLRTWVLESSRRHPVLVVRYEDVSKNWFGELKRMLDFLAFPYQDQELRRRMKHDFTSFHRAHTLPQQPFSPDLRAVMCSALHNVSQEVQNSRVEQVLRLDEYIPPECHSTRL